MSRLSVFNHVSLDGYFTDANGDMSWSHAQDPEWMAFVQENAKGDGRLVFGRVTYDLMVSYWPTPMAMKNSPAVAERMNQMPKVVFSRTMDKASWSNTKLVKGDIAAEVRKLKSEAGPDMTILGSGSLVAQLAPEGLIDDYQIVVSPIAIGKGKTLFEGVEKKLRMKLVRSRAFGNGNVVLSYEPA